MFERIRTLLQYPKTKDINGTTMIIGAVVNYGRAQKYIDNCKELKTNGMVGLDITDATLKDMQKFVDDNKEDLCIWFSMSIYCEPTWTCLIITRKRMMFPSGVMLPSMIAEDKEGWYRIHIYYNWNDAEKVDISKWNIYTHLGEYYQKAVDLAMPFVQKIAEVSNKEVIGHSYITCHFVPLGRSRQIIRDL